MRPLLRVLELGLACAFIAAAASDDGRHNAYEALHVQGIKHTSQAARELAIGPGIGSVGLGVGSDATVSFSQAVIAQGELVVVTARSPTLAANSTYNTFAWVGVWSPSNSDVSTSTPVRFQMCIADPQWLTNGTCAITMQLNNLHTGGYAAYLILGGLSGGLTPTSGKSITASPVAPSTTLYGGSKPWVSLTGENGLTEEFGGVVLARSPNELTFADPGAPTHVRVTPGLLPGRLRVSWNQRLGSVGGAVSWARSAAALAAGGGLTVPAVSRVLSLNDVCRQGPAATIGFRDMGTTWTAELDLTSVAGSRIVYVVGDDRDMLAAPLILTVPPLPGRAFPFSFAAWADQGLGYAPGDESYSGRNAIDGVTAYAVSRRAAALVAAGDIDAVVISGDVSYADGYSCQWEDFFEQSQAHAAGVVTFVSSGNHDSDWYLETSPPKYASANGETQSQSYWRTDISSGGECGLLLKLFPSADATPSALYYSYALGPITFVVYNTEANFTRGSTQHTWLEKTLAEIDRSVTPWVVATGHRPMYVDTNSYGNNAAFWGSDLNGMLQLQAEVEPLFFKFRVNVNFQGHTHVTQRQCACLQGLCAENATRGAGGVWTYTGASGATVQYNLGNAGYYPGSGPNVENSFTAWTTTLPGYAVMTAVSPTELIVTIRNPLDNAILDVSRILQAPWPAPALPSPLPRPSAPRTNLVEILCIVLITLGLASGAVGVWAHMKRVRSSPAAAKGAAAPQAAASADHGTV